MPRDAVACEGSHRDARQRLRAGHDVRGSYRAANPPVAGLGFVAIRDTAAWLKHQPDALAPVRYAYGFGSSQSGRFLRSFLYEGFNTDERDRQVFDAVFAHIAGASRINLNERWSTPVGLGAYNATAFPFADAGLADPVSGARDGLLANSRMGAHAPKVFYTNTPVEYWGVGRVAALVHTNPEGTADLPLPENVRFYFIAGTQHSPSRFPPAVTNGQQEDNAVDYWWTMRALLMAMHKWVKEGVAPPPSQYPRLQDRTLVPAASVAFPAIPASRRRARSTAGARIANPSCRAAPARARRCRCSCPRWTRTATSARAFVCPRSRCLSPRIPAGISASLRSAPQASSSRCSARRSRSRRRAPRARAAKDPRRSIEERYRSQRRVPRASGAGPRRARPQGLPDLRRWTADPAAGGRSVGSPRY